MNEYTNLHSMEEIDAFISKNPLSFLYISSPGCSVCHGLWPQIQNLLGKYPQIKLAHIDTSDVEEVAGRFSVFTVPVLLLFIERKEYIRKARIVHLDELNQEISRILDAYEA
ncbi:thioredoxin family protein [Aciduricibacillus chroicocephali]|uniref:Thioredoxin family protein n=1 Tax=Aciduricibacillus chroicocephali TaxID=3054939 RepID=A0ABY9KW31_9BACI|nr:thioredoxin family protein [Bacillaceae bacterium 44XB]